MRLHDSREQQSQRTSEKTENRNRRKSVNKIYTTLNIPEKKRKKEKRNVNENLVFLRWEIISKMQRIKEGRELKGERKKKKKRTQWSEVKET